MKTKILGTGLSGLVGTRIVELLSDKFEFVDLSYATGVDITHYDNILKNFRKHKDADVVLHMAAKTDVDACEDDKILMEEGSAWRINVEGTKNIVEAAKKTKKRLIYISTDFVFDGTKDQYTEDDEPNPLNWYAYTKFEGEKAVIGSGLSYAVLRLAYPYRAYFPERMDFVRRIMEKAKKDGEIMALSDHIFTPTFIDDLATVLKHMFIHDLSGIFHAVGSTNLIPVEAGKIILEKFGIRAKIKTLKRDEYFKNRAFRPFKLALKNDKIRKLGIKMHGFEEGLDEVKKQLKI